MPLHITGGEFRNRKLDSVSGNSARPTSSFVRNAMFNILGDKVTDANA
ncbi:MAG: 16S rRNA (guanine(966)-N(2))-methyltransferase RsmD, partial [candidate division Zixibacteria bacterium]|nr:16S rRNA (guanine(966)-N(2))-methyltransferase RsmD [candidate division Zixibacteria bacterium]